VDSAGAAMGSGGLLVFALIVWKLLPGRSGSMVLAGATLAWVIVAMSIWEAQGKLRQVQRKSVAAKSINRLIAVGP